MLKEGMEEGIEYSKAGKGLKVTEMNTDREWIMKMAEKEDQCESIAAGKPNLDEE